MDKTKPPEDTPDWTISRSYNPDDNSEEEEEEEEDDDDDDDDDDDK